MSEKSKDDKGPLSLEALAEKKQSRNRIKNRSSVVREMTMSIFQRVLVCAVAVVVFGSAFASDSSKPTEKDGVSVPTTAKKTPSPVTAGDKGQDEVEDHKDKNDPSAERFSKDDPKALPKKAPPRMLGPKELMSRPDYKEMVQRLKDEGKYYHPNTVKELRDKAEKGDAWAVRELPWPKEHRLHKMGRPYFRNDKPHPEGLFPHSGL